MVKNKKENEKYNAKNTPKIEKLISASLILAFTVFIISSASAATHVFAVSQTSTTLPTCTDPTGQNLPCMMVISTLPAPANAVQCQESSGQKLSCSYATQNLSNGQQVVVITVYVPANFVFSNPTVIKVVVHETTSTTGGGGGDGQNLSHKLGGCNLWLKSGLQKILLLEEIFKLSPFR
ncbi:MAG: hypothetical protein DLM72_13175 [Candidatus Nitrosopolaris wilkensis]|nr:MAG: hypothetical protein DLM72_13175 [Candidatus Nitrosopolaris wilkensis]